MTTVCLSEIETTFTYQYLAADFDVAVERTTRIVVQVFFGGADQQSS